MWQPSKKSGICWLLTAVAALGPSAAGESAPQRSAQGNVLVSQHLPAIRARLDEAFDFAGRIEFTIRDVAAGERYIFVDDRDGHVERLFIAQFEGFLPTSDDFYRYRFDDALLLGGHRFRQNTFAFSQRAAATTNPTGESALTAEFLRARGFELDDEWMMSRFVTVPDEEKKHELILFYMERLRATGHRLGELYEDDQETPLWTALSKQLTARSLESFEIQ